MNPQRLKPVFSPLGIFAFSIGASIGWGSFLVVCDAYLHKSGLLGTTLGLLLGTTAILVAAWNIQYMIRVSPDAGGVYTFQKRLNGNDIGFVSFWFVFQVYLAVLWGNITAVPIFVQTFFGDAFHFGFHYRILTDDVWLGEILLSIGAIALVGIFCSRCTRALNKLMETAAIIFVGGFALCALGSVLLHESAFSYEPLFADGASRLVQVASIAVISPWAFIGFENAAHFSEEYDFPIKKVRAILIGSVLATAALYLLVSLLSISAYPPEYVSWHEYIEDLGNLEGIKALPAFYAAYHYLGIFGVAVLLLSLFCVVLTSLVANTMAASRVLYAAGREHDAPPLFGRLNRYGIPSNAIWAVILISCVVPFLDKTAIEWTVDVTTLGAILAYGLISHGVFVHARQNGRGLEKCTGAVGMVLMACLLLMLLVPGLLPVHAME